MKTRYSRVVWAGFELVFRPWMRRRLDGIHLRGAAEAARIPRDVPVLLVSNHVSWWDGFLIREVHRSLRPDAPLHVIMLEEELRRHRLFQWMGAVGLDRSRLGARNLLRDLRGHLNRRADAVITFFPQGRIWPSHKRPLGFQRGGGWLATRLAPIAVVPVGLHLEPLTAPGPAAFVSVGSPVMVADRIRTEELEAMTTVQLDLILSCTRTFGEDAAARWREGWEPGREAMS